MSATAPTAPTVVAETQTPVLVGQIIDAPKAAQSKFETPKASAAPEPVVLEGTFVEGPTPAANVPSTPVIEYVEKPEPATFAPASGRRSDRGTPRFSTPSNADLNDAIYAWASSTLDALRTPASVPRAQRAANTERSSQPVLTFADEYVERLREQLGPDLATANANDFKYGIRQSTTAEVRREVEELTGLKGYRADAVADYIVASAAAETQREMGAANRLPDPARNSRIDQLEHAARVAEITMSDIQVPQVQIPGTLMVSPVGVTRESAVDIALKEAERLPADLNEKLGTADRYAFSAFGSLGQDVQNLADTLRLQNPDLASYEASAIAKYAVTYKAAELQRDEFGDGQTDFSPRGLRLNGLELELRYPAGMGFDIELPTALETPSLDMSQFEADFATPQRTMSMTL